MSFRRRLSLSIVALILALTAVLSVVYLRYLLKMQMELTFKQAEMVTRQVESAMLDILSVPPQTAGEQNSNFLHQAVRDDGQLREVLLRSQGNFDTIAEIAITDEKGDVLLDSVDNDRWLSRQEFRALSDRGFIEQVRSLYGPQRDYEISRAFAYAGRPVLVLHVAVSTTFLWRQLQPEVRNLGLAALFSLAAALVLAILFSRVAFRPLGRLGEAIDRMTRGEFAPALPPETEKGTEYGVISSKLSLLGRQFRDAREGITSLRGNMEQLMSKLEGAVLLFDADDRLIIASAAAESILGSGRWQIMGRSLEEVFPASTKLGAVVEAAVRLRQPMQNQLVELEPPPPANGSPGGKAEGAADPPPARPERVLLTVELMEDFTSRKRLGTMVLLRDAETRRAIEDEMEVSTRLAAIGRITSSVAHEIKNPLNAITLHLELLKNRLAAAQTSPPELEVIANEMSRLDRVVKTFLDFTRPVNLKLSEVKIDALLEEIAALAKPDARAHKVRIEVLNGCSDAVIRADRDLLKQAVLNLAVNAIQAMPEGGELKLGVARVGAEVEVSVADQGMGIAPKDREKIFRLYFTTKKGGSGIGLAMAFRVVQLHNGTIDFSSEVGSGTTFRLRFPVVEAR